MHFEKIYLSAVRAFVAILPRRIRLRIAKLLTDFDYRLLKGVRFTVRYESDLLLAVNTKDAIGWRVFMTGEYEPITNKVIRAYCGPQCVVLDAGANIGTEALVAAKSVGPSGKVFAFEPVPVVYRAMVQNIEINNLQARITAFQFALGSEAKSVEFHLMAPEMPNQGMSSAHRFPESSQTILVQQIALDAWVSQTNCTRLDFIKMDIQGGELNMLKGGLGTLRKFRPIIFTEAGEAEQRQAGSTLHEFGAYIEGLGYDIFEFTRASRTPSRVDLSSPLSDGSWLCIPSERFDIYNVQRLLA